MLECVKLLSAIVKKIRLAQGDLGIPLILKGCGAWF